MRRMNSTRFGWVIAGTWLAGLTALTLVALELKREIGRIQAHPAAVGQPAFALEDPVLAQRVLRLEDDVRRLEAALRNQQAGAVDPGVVREAVEEAMSQEEDRRKKAAARASLEKVQNTLKVNLDVLARKIGLDAGQQSAVYAIMANQMENLLSVRQSAAPENLREALDKVNVVAYEKILAILKEEQRGPFVEGSRAWFGGMMMPAKLKDPAVSGAEDSHR